MSAANFLNYTPELRGFDDFSWHLIEISCVRDFVHSICFSAKFSVELIQFFFFFSNIIAHWCVSTLDTPFQFWYFLRIYAVIREVWFHVPSKMKTNKLKEGKEKTHTHTQHAQNKEQTYLSRLRWHLWWCVYIQQYAQKTFPRFRTSVKAS